MMTAIEMRMLKCQVLEQMRRNPDLFKRMEVRDVSTFNGKQINDCNKSTKGK